MKLLGQSPQYAPGKKIKRIRLDESGPVLARVRDAAQQLFDGESPSLPDKQGRVILGMCAVVLAVYRKLSTVTVDAQHVYSLVEAAFRKSYQTLFKLMYGSLLTFAIRSGVCRVWIWRKTDKE